MQLSKEKIELIKKTIPEIYNLILNITSLVEEDLKFVKNISKDEIEKLENHDLSSLNMDLRLAYIQKRLDAFRGRLRETVSEFKVSLELKKDDSLSEVLLSKEVSESLNFDERFIASAIAKSISKIKDK